jgi:hypothetical protein
VKNISTDYSKPVKQEVNGTVKHPPLVFPDVRLGQGENLNKGRGKMVYTKITIIEIHFIGVLCTIIVAINGIKMIIDIV